MKKTFAALSVLLALAAGVMFTGCERLQEIFDEVKEEVEGPKNQWQKCEVNYKVGEQSIKLNCYVLYSEDGYTNKDMKFKAANPDYDETVENSKKYLYVTKLEPGLSICVQPKLAASEASDSEKALIQNLFGSSVKCFAVKTFPKDAVIEGEAGESKFKANATTWTLLYNLIRETVGADKGSLPSVLNVDVSDDYANIEVDGAGINWKTIAAALIINQLTKE